MPIINFMQRIYQLSLFIITISLIASCAVQKKPGNSLPNNKEIRKVFSVGYKAIINKYIEKLSIQNIGLAGLNGFSSIHPFIRAENSEGYVTLFYGQKDIKSWKVPINADVNTWIDIIDDATVITNQHSKKIAQATKEEILTSLFNGAIEKLDKFSRYVGAKETKKNRAKRNGFGGIGVYLKIIRNKAIISRVIENSPAAEMGLKIGDHITHVNGVLVSTLEKKNLVNILRGPKMTDVSLLILRDQLMDPITIKITRDHIYPISVVENYNDKIIHFKISSFNQNTASSFTKKLTRTLNNIKLPLDGIILDLRGNPGGVLKQSIKLSDVFLNKGKIISTSGRHFDSINQYTAGEPDLSEGLPIIVIINRKSASAAESLAATLQDRGRAVVIGSTSYGKGTIQTVIPLPNDGEIILTWSKFIAPSGYTIDGLGVLPTICTSNGTYKPNPYIKEFIPYKKSLSIIFKHWRTLGDKSTNLQNKLRASCPPKKRTSDYDLKIAKDLLKKPHYYKTILKLFSPSSAEVSYNY